MNLSSLSIFKRPTTLKIPDGAYVSNTRQRAYPSFSPVITSNLPLSLSLLPRLPVLWLSPLVIQLKLKVGGMFPCVLLFLCLSTMPSSPLSFTFPFCFQFLFQLGRLPGFIYPTLWWHSKAGTSLHFSFFHFILLFLPLLIPFFFLSQLRTLHAKCLCLFTPDLQIRPKPTSFYGAEISES